MPSSPAVDRRPFLLYIRNPATGLLVSDGLTYRGERIARREALKITRVLGLEAEARPAA
jgi:hypothetical protein